MKSSLKFDATIFLTHLILWHKQNSSGTSLFSLFPRLAVSDMNFKRDPLDSFPINSNENEENKEKKKVTTPVACTWPR